MLIVVAVMLQQIHVQKQVEILVGLLMVIAMVATIMKYVDMMAVTAVLLLV